MGKYDAVQQKLEIRRQELQERLDRIKADLSRPHEADSEEQAQERENDEVLNQLGRDAEQQLRTVNRSLERIQAGRYGICASCSAEIPLTRLAAKPDTVHCVTCAA